MWVAAASFVAAMLIVCLDVILRYFLNCPIIWGIEICEYILLGIAFFSAPGLLREEEHVKVEIVLYYMKPKSQALLNTITSVLGAVVFFVITWYAAKTTWGHFVRSVPIMKSLRIPMAPLLAVITVGTFLLFIQFVRRSSGYLRRWATLRSKIRSS
jgi:TRAP-type C4-dicarboxylate transport system permease small subunit